MSDIASRGLNSDSCPSYTLQRRPSMMKRLRRSFRRAITNKEVLASESKMVSDALQPSLSAEMLNSPEEFTDESCGDRSSGQMTFSATTLWDNLVSYLETNVNPGTRRRSLRMYNNCFFGHEAVNCLHKYITTNLLRQCDRDQVAILCHRFLVLGIIEDAKYGVPEAEQDFNAGLLYRLTAQKKFWLSSEHQETDGCCKEESPVTETCLSDTCGKATEEETSNKCSKNMQRRRSLRQSLLEVTKCHLKENRPSIDHRLRTEHDDTEMNSRTTNNSDEATYSSTDNKSTAIDADSSSSSSKGTASHSEETRVAVHHKAKKLVQTRKRRWHSVKEKTQKAGTKQPHLIPQLKKMSIKKKQNISSSEGNKHWVTFGFI